MRIIAKSHTNWFKPISTVGYLGMVACLIALLVIRALFSVSPIVIALQVASLLLLLWARFTLGWRSFQVAANPTEGGLVTSGPYRYIRHPIYTAMCVFGWAGIAAHWSWGAVVCGAVLIAFALLRIVAEETLVTQRYPEYADYATRTWRMIPFLF
jgi:protein-S-isoprenylcysteine O-methyltransferase Ste14